MKRLSLIIPVAVLLLAGCAAPAPVVEVSAACTEAMSTLAADDGTDFDREDALIADTTTKCATWEEYLAAVEANPAAWLYEDASEVAALTEQLKENLFYSACANERKTTTMCADAYERGIFE